ncbi:hypothetical protein DFH08DRAFT_917520 [Mycena albidolilacea]|uniref:Uncharacterized protein n=1 Tax=Mycena albidolilacea TaxID=1033008 RepID=A0AAD6ZEJ5_9AGAR|nr:hypothetical protein DFH08DRAFT_917520 [Mycena albidolilacea]
MKAIIWVMKECKTPDVPSFYALRKLQKKLTEDVGLKPRHHTSSLNNQFYMNHPNDLIRLDFSNPLVREHLHFYPESTTTISESWQAGKYVNEIADDDLSPMWANWEGASYRHFYVKELAQCINGKYIVPLKWIVYKKQVHCDAYLVMREASGIFTVEEHELVRVIATDLRYNFLDLEKQGEVQFSGVQNAFKPHTPHPIRAIACGKPVFVLRIMPWADDVSGNRSKQYNAHMNMYLANLNLPHKLLSQEYFVRFCATSQHASSLEQFDALAGDCKDDSWSLTYDCKLQQEILFRIGIHLLPADNPQQAETTSTAGSSATFWCREDDSGGSASHRETDEGYHALYLIRAACLGVAAAVEQLQTDSGVKDKISVHWIGLLIDKAREIQKQRIFNHETRDPRLGDAKIVGDARKAIKQGLIETIREELYTWVIMQPPERYEKLDQETREDKYVWHETNKVWNDEQGALFAARLQSASLDGLNIPSLRSKYMVQYKKSLIGKYYKALQQLGIFQLDATLCSQEVFELWKANGVLGGVLWFPEIKDMDQYLADLKVAIDNVLDCWAVVDPNQITQKYKLHVLPHLPEAVRRFGPSILFATEIFECWNSVFRLCSVLSNHQAPSLDIATTLADMERFKHQVSGGWWKPVDGDWTQAGSEIQNFLTANRQLQRRLGWAPHDLIKPGTVKVLSKAKQQQPASWKTALGSSWNDEITQPINHSNTNWIGCKFVAARSEDPCYPGSWVFFSDGSKAPVVIQPFTISNNTDPRYDMPVLIKTGKTIVVKPEHDCLHFSCPLVHSVGPQQERSESRLTQKLTAHKDDSRFLVNTHGLHNAHLVREALPRHLTAPKPCFADRRRLPAADPLALGSAALGRGAADTPSAAY